MNNFLNYNESEEERLQKEQARMQRLERFRSLNIPIPKNYNPNIFDNSYVGTYNHPVNKPVKNTEILEKIHAIKKGEYRIEIDKFLKGFYNTNIQLENIKTEDRHNFNIDEYITNSNIEISIREKLKQAMQKNESQKKELLTTSFDNAHKNYNSPETVLKKKNRFIAFWNNLLESLKIK